LAGGTPFAAGVAREREDASRARYAIEQVAAEFGISAASAIMSAAALSGINDGS